MLDPLATADDLAARGITVPGGMDEDVLLDAASAEVRRAAAHPISSIESTVTLVATDYCELDLPAGPVTEVTTVTVNAVEVTGWVLLGDTLTMPTGWTSCLPVNVTIGYTHGLPVVPADIVDLVCGMVSIAANLGGEGYGTSGRTDYIKLGDYAERAAVPAGTESPSPMSLPDRVAQRLLARFGGSAELIDAGRR